MISGNDDITFRKATEKDLENIKSIADMHRQELGFVRRPALLEAICREEVTVAENVQNLVGFIHYHHRRDVQTTLYDIVVIPEYRFLGIGKALVDHLMAEAQSLGKRSLVLKCPAELPSNAFYAHLGFERWREELGKRRSLVVWRFVF